MSRISSCNTSNLAEIELLGAPVSLPSEPPAQPAGQALPDASAPVDTFEQAPRGSPFASSETFFSRAEKPRDGGTKYGPDQLPEPPQSPRELAATVDPTGLRGPELERALGHNEQCWRDYAQSYREYLDGYRAAFAGCKDLDQLRDLQPEPPDDAMAQVGYEQRYEGLDRELRRLYGEKVDRGYELIGETPPGTLILMLKGSVNLLGAGAKATLSADSKGRTAVETKATVESPMVKLGLDDRGRVDAKVGVMVDGYGAKVGSRGVELEGAKLGGLTRAKASFNRESGKLAVGAEVVPGVGFKASYDASEAVYGGGITVGKTLTSPDGTTLAEVKAEADLMLKGMSKQDVKRALSGWLVPDRLRGGKAGD